MNMKDTQRNQARLQKLITDEDFDKRLDELEDVENGQVFLCESNNTHAHLKLRGQVIQYVNAHPECTHVWLMFGENVSRSKVNKSARIITDYFTEYRRKIEIDVTYEIPRDLMILVKAVLETENE